MKGGNLSRHKKTKMGQKPGDVHLGIKIAMLEGNVRALVAHTEYLHEPNPAKTQTKRARGYKKEHARKANRRTRHAPIVMED